MIVQCAALSSRGSSISTQGFPRRSGASEAPPSRAAPRRCFPLLDDEAPAQRTGLRRRIMSSPDSEPEPTESTRPLRSGGDTMTRGPSSSRDSSADL
ncbi:hypothetical protein FQA47_014697 [Oryzias melastigma]|uniref:Uncharacterized protein n=1 Tax=Oryzias melastigma TaxID=30732 RepID=A0A834C5E8_ORYME|nr:hypothetical protein FQA47_014697 [Oryzias melastigma]